jgi:hypothetical protein
MRRRNVLMAFALNLLCIHTVGAQVADPVAPYHAANDAFLEVFRRTGARDPTALFHNLPKLEALAAVSGGELRARAFLEIGFIQRISFHLERAASAYGHAAELAAALNRSDLLFQACIGLARSQSLSNDHGAATSTLERAAEAAGRQPTARQRFEIALDRGEFAESRGEIDSALAYAVEAFQLAPKAEDRVDALRDAGNALYALVATCNYRPLRDSHTVSDPLNDVWGACRRAISVGEDTYNNAARSADQLGWKGTAQQARELLVELQSRRVVLSQVMKSYALPDPQGLALDPNIVRFTPQNSSQVLVQKGEYARSYLAAELTMSPVTPELLALIERTVADAASTVGNERPGVLTLQAQIADVRGRNAALGTTLLTQAADLLMKERASYFDARRRGAVLERQADLFTNLALRLIGAHQDEAAFAMFESTRARGLGELAEFLGRENVSDVDRAWLAQQVGLDAQSDAVAQRMTEHILGDGHLALPPEELLKWERGTDQQRLHLLGHSAFRERMSHQKTALASLADLQRASTAAGIPVLLYWVANPNVYAWYVGPHGSEFRTIFLPQTALQHRVAELTQIERETGTLNEQAARQLYLYLLAPFSDLLDSRQLIIVPQGDILDVPFEILIEPESGEFAIERHVISYSPNATMALHSLTRRVPSIRKLTAVVDPDIDDGTHETRAIRSLGRLDVRVVDASGINSDRLRESLSGVPSTHILLHGEFRSTEPLLSTLHPTSPTANAITAADMLSIPMAGNRLVVLSACESGEIERRISNEIYGFPWALLAAGAENVVASRWRVNGASNSVWMGQFYGAISMGASPAEAAALATRFILKTERMKPYYWAAMQVIGR